MKNHMFSHKAKKKVRFIHLQISFHSYCTGFLATDWQRDAALKSFTEI